MLVSHTGAGPAQVQCYPQPAVIVLDEQLRVQPGTIAGPALIEGYAPLLAGPLQIATGKQVCRPWALWQKGAQHSNMWWPFLGSVLAASGCNVMWGAIQWLPSHLHLERQELLELLIELLLQRVKALTHLPCILAWIESQAGIRLFHLILFRLRRRSVACARSSTNCRMLGLGCLGSSQASWSPLAF